MTIANSIMRDDSMQFSSNDLYEHVDLEWCNEYPTEDKAVFVFVDGSIITRISNVYREA